MVMGYVPAGVEELAVTVRTEVPVAAIDDELKLLVRPLTAEIPSTLRAMLPLIPPRPKVPMSIVACLLEMVAPS